ncbi:hypothetical protein H4R35_006284 [Dimargaris xerosporica]|nr:hypothetical protein H4R35_006284 [Dimargaris xerosporica]
MDVDETKTEATDPCEGEWDAHGLLEANRPLFAEKPVRPYLEDAVLPVLRGGLRQLAIHRPADPCAFLGHYLLQHRNPTQPEVKSESSNAQVPPPSDPPAEGEQAKAD